MQKNAFFEGCKGIFLKRVIIK